MIVAGKSRPQEDSSRGFPDETVHERVRQRTSQARPRLLAVRDGVLDLFLETALTAAVVVLWHVPTLPRLGLCEVLEVRCCPVVERLHQLFYPVAVQSGQLSQPV